MKINSIDNKVFVVYKHTNKINNKSYIGITSRKPAYRWGHDGRQYLNKHKDGSYVHSKFAPAIILYGWNNFTHDILEEGLSGPEALKKEFEYSLQYESCTNGYNCKCGEDRNFNISKYTKNKISKRVSGGNNPHAKKVIAIDPLTNELLKVFECANIAAKDVGGKSGKHIIDCCLKKREFAYGFKWKYYVNEEFSQKDNILEYQYKKMQLGRARPVIIIDSDKNEYEFISVNEAAAFLKLSVNIIKKALRLNRSISDKYMITYKSNIHSKKKYSNSNKGHHILKLSSSYNIIKEYSSLKQACNECNISENTIKKYSNSREIYKGYFWIFKEEYEAYCSRVAK